MKRDGEGGGGGKGGIGEMKLAERAGIHLTYLADTERGERNIAVVSIVRIARALDVPLDKLFGAVVGELRRGRGRLVRG
jgi:transcriptional regulator with XRE-family HTH domain